MVVVTETGSVTVVVGSMINSYDCRDQYISFRCYGVDRWCRLASKVTYRTHVSWSCVGESLATMAIHRAGGSFRHGPINCRGGATVKASSAYCRSGCTLFSGHGRSDEKGYRAEEEN